LFRRKTNGFDINRRIPDSRGKNSYLRAEFDERSKLDDERRLLLDTLRNTKPNRMLGLRFGMIGDGHPSRIRRGLGQAYGCACCPAEQNDQGVECAAACARGATGRRTPHHSGRRIKFGIRRGCGSPCRQGAGRRYWVTRA
jgi:hypothetical protein